MTLATALAILASIWGPFLRSPDAPAIGVALIQAAREAPLPWLGEEGTLAVLAEYTRGESGVRLHPTPWRGADGQPVDCEAHGFLQLHGAAGHLDPVGQARAWLTLARYGAVVCPDAPLAPLTGGSCTRGRALAEKRVKAALGAVP